MKLYTKLLIIFLLFFTVNVQAGDLQTSGKYFEIENKGITVKYSQNSCGYLSKYVLLNVVDDGNAGEFPWIMMVNKRFQKTVLDKECKRLNKVMEDYRDYIKRIGR